jgi:hypothetical protein
MMVEINQKDPGKPGFLYDPERIKDHVDTANKIVKVYDALTKSGGTCVRDLLTDLMHWCEANDIEFAKEYYWAEAFYMEESTRSKREFKKIT